VVVWREEILPSGG